MNEPPLQIDLDTAKSLDRPSHRSNILSGFASMGGGLLIARAIAFLGTAILTRRLGPYGFGIVGLAVAISSYFALAIQNSIGPVGSREVARRSEVPIAMIKGVIAVRLLLATIGIALITAIVLVLDKPSDVKKVIWLTSLTMVAQVPMTDWVYKGLGRLRMVGLSLILNQCVYVAILLWLIRTPASVVWVPAALIGGQLAAALCLGLPLFRGSSESTDLAAGIRILKQSRYVVVSKLLTNLMRMADVLLLGLIVGES
ncbi:MAG: oligosaccharide flippase family protein, partial [Acidobacteriota bacterium]